MVCGIVFMLYPWTLNAQKNANKALHKTHQEKINKAFKNKPLWYRLWNRYDINPGFSKYALGYSKSFPLYKWTNPKYKGGFRYRNNHLEFGMSFWTGVEAGQTIESDVNRFSLGYFTPLHFFSIGRRYLDVKGFLCQPALALGYTYNNRNHGLYIAPSMHFQFPFLVVELRSHFEFTDGAGFNIFPELSLELDALYSLLDPHKTKTGIWESYSTYASPLGGGWYKVTSTYARNDYMILDIGPFWGITPRLGIYPDFLTGLPHKSYGIGASGRINFLGADIHYDRGFLQTGILTNHKDLHQTIKHKFDNEKVKGLVPIHSFSFEANFNVWGILLGIFKKQAIRQMGVKVTPLNRFNFHLGLVYINVGTPNYKTPADAITYTDHFFDSNPTIERTSINDPLQLANEWGVTYGWSYEMGAIGLRVNHKLSKRNGKSSIFELYYIVPISKIIKVYKH